MFGKIFTAVCAAGHEAEEAAVNHQALRILGQEICDAEVALRTSTQELIAVMARKKAEQRQKDAIATSIAAFEEQARIALVEGKSNIAMEIAKRIVDLNKRHHWHADSLQTMIIYVERMRRSIETAESRTAEMKHELSFAKARDAMQRIDVRIRRDCTISHNVLGEAEYTLRRVKSLQQQREDEIAACAEFNAEKQPHARDICDGEMARNRDHAAREILRQLNPASTAENEGA